MTAPDLPRDVEALAILATAVLDALAAALPDDCDTGKDMHIGGAAHAALSNVAALRRDLAARAAQPSLPLARRVRSRSLFNMESRP